MIKRTVTTYYVLSILTRFATSFFMATYASYLMARGLDLFQMNLVNTLFAISTLVLEVPTGVIADVFGRKASFVASCIFWGASMLLYARAETFALCVAAELLGAFAKSSAGANSFPLE